MAPALRGLLLASLLVGLGATELDWQSGALTTPQIMSLVRYRSEVHWVETHDGYILQMHRLVSSPRSGPGDSTKPPVLLMHGLMGSSADWILIGPDAGLPYLLADRGYDVWLGNARGNRYSRNHSYLSTEEREFWDFSFHEIGYYDMPAMVDHVLASTGQTKLHYVGHSQGTTVFFILNALRPEYNAKFHLMQALAPAVFMSHLRNPFIQFLARHEAAATSFVASLGIFEFSPYPDVAHKLASALCPEFFGISLCLNAIHLITGNKYCHITTNALPMFIGHLPAGSSTKQVSHFGQEIDSGKFRPFDYGTERNMALYGTPEPPDYNLTNVVAPVAIYYGQADELVHPIDVRQLAATLPNLVAFNRQANETFNHMDFLVAGNVKDALYDSVIGNIERWNAEERLGHPHRPAMEYLRWPDNALDEGSTQVQSRFRALDT